MTNLRGVPPQAAAPEDRGAAGRWVALVVLCVSLLIVTLDNTILNVALPTLVRELGATTTQLQWIVDAYALVFAGLILVAGSTADRFGRRRVFTAGLAVFGVTSAWGRVLRLDGDAHRGKGRHGRGRGDDDAGHSVDHHGPVP
ncbi:MFS transporter [Streptomyces sp. NPDC050549]|uniref:MFS transporter n=1 Tax=Streptomyces sp. NPDC050549 TaxID=3155406 RepID=UPI003428BEC5